MKIIKTLEINEYEKVTKLELIANNENLKLIHLNNKIHSSWLIKETIFPVDENIKQKLNKLNDHECSIRLKNANCSKLIFAAKVQNGSIIKTEDSVLFCYLLTQIKLYLPYLLMQIFY